MNKLTFDFEIGGQQHHLRMIFVEGTGTGAYWFGEDGKRQPIRISDFFIADIQTTQALWKYIMGEDANPAAFKGDDMPAEHVSWLDITKDGGFLTIINNSDIITFIKTQLPAGANPVFRLPSETEWEYAARGGKHWRDEFIFSGSNSLDEVAWYLNNSGRHTWPVAQKKANQLELYDMCGNLWEWCEDVFIRDTSQIPKDGAPFLTTGKDRVLRGGCHHNMAVHCTIFKRYEIAPDSFDECIGFRVALSF